MYQYMFQILLHGHIDSSSDALELYLIFELRQR